MAQALRNFKVIEGGRAKPVSIKINKRGKLLWRGHEILYPTYRFIDKSPIIDKLRTAIQDKWECHGNDRVFKAALREISNGTNLGYGTLWNWFYGETKKPQEAPLNAVAHFMGGRLEFVWDN